MTPKNAYDWLRINSTKTHYLSSLGELAAWDQRISIPLKGHPHRAEQLAVLALTIHERSTVPNIDDHLKLVEDSSLIEDPTSPEAVNVREWRRAFDKLTRVPNKLQENLARATAESETAWEHALPNNDWESFKPHLNTLLSLLKEKAAAIGYDKEPYDVLLDEYEPGETAQSLEQLFSQCKPPLVTLLERIRGSKMKPDTSLLKRDYPVENQKRFSHKIAQMLGYDFDAGRLDETTHPFTIGITPGDVRITTRYAENYFPSGLFGTIHESGHGIYEQGLREEHFGCPMGQANSLGVHESQSRLYENFVGRSRGFWKHIFPMAQSEFSHLKDVNLYQFILSINAVEPSLVRVEADEVTYNLHIILRFELELALMRGDLQIDDLPDAWNQKMNDYFGITPPDMARGVMQDVHWAAGLFGYFPTYTLGNVYSAQLFDTAVQELGDQEEAFANGQFSPLLGWLKKNVHEKGGMYRPRDLIAKATGHPPDPKYLIKYFETKFGELYKI